MFSFFRDPTAQNFLNPPNSYSQLIYGHEFPETRNPENEETCSLAPGKPGKHLGDHIPGSEVSSVLAQL